MALFNQAMDAVVGMDSRGRIIAWNPTAERMFGWLQSEVLDKEMGEIIVPPQHRSAHAQGLANFLRTGEGPVLNKKITVTAIRRSGEEFPIELSITDIASRDDTVFFAFIRSLEEQHALAREREMRRRLAETVAAISDAQVQLESAAEFIDFCIARICEATGWPLGHFYAMDESERPARLRPTEHWHISDPRYAAAVETTKQYTFEKGVGLPGTCWASDDVVVLTLDSDATFSRSEAFRALDLSKGLAIPIRGRDGLAGVMEFFAPATTRDQTELQLFARTIANHVAVTLQRKADAAEQEVLRRELAHRASNSFAILQSVLRRCYRSSSSTQDLYETFEPRLMSVSRAHNNLIGTSRKDVTLASIIEDELDLLPDCDRVSTGGPDVPLPTQAILPVTVVIHELVTNTLKYGVWHETGSLSVTWNCEPMQDGPNGATRRITLTWRESPTDRETLPQEGGYGSTLIRAMIQSTLKGCYERRVDNGDFLFEARFPL